MNKKPFREIVCLATFVAKQAELSYRLAPGLRCYHEARLKKPFAELRIES